MSNPGKILSVLLVFVLAISISLPVFSAGRERSISAKVMLEITNKARKKAGLEALKLDDDLQESAQIRALELTQKYSKDHKRPNGQFAFSASTKIWAENISYGYKNEEDAMNGWLSSKGHLANIMDKRFTIIGIACAEGEDGTLYWAQNFGTGTSNRFWAMRDFKVKTFTLDPFNDPQTPLDKTKKASTTASLVDKDGDISASGLNAALKKSILETKTGTVTVKVKNAKSISPEALKSFAATAAGAGRAATISADTLTSDGKSVQGRMVIEPAKLTGRKTDIKLGVYTDKDSVAGIKTAMRKKYSNTMAYISMSHRGSLTANARVSVKVDLTGLDTGNLLFYLYDAQKGIITPISEPNYSTDSSGYLNFTVNTAGDIVITNTKLQ